MQTWEVRCILFYLSSQGVSVNRLGCGTVQSAAPQLFVVCLFLWELVGLFLVCLGVYVAVFVFVLLLCVFVFFATVLAGCQSLTGVSEV